MDVQGIHPGFGGIMSRGTALTGLRSIAGNRLTPWFVGDLRGLEGAYLEAAGILD